MLLMLQRQNRISWSVGRGQICHPPVHPGYWRRGPEELIQRSTLQRDRLQGIQTDEGLREARHPA